MARQQLLVFVSLSVAALNIIANANANGSIVGDTHNFLSPNGVTETCVALAKMPGGDYSAEDARQEQVLCGIDIYDSNVAICPKLSSTSPGTFVYGLANGAFANDQAGFEREVCPRGHTIVAEADGPPASFKVTMNDPETSGTFSTASLLYYHFSRYFDAHVHVPVAVYRSVDRTTHEQRVTARGLNWSDGQKSLRMNNAAWRVLDRVEKSPEKYSATDELFTSDRRSIYGVLLHVSGKRYGAEINGTRKSGWGDGQNRDFQQTAPFLALKSSRPLQQAIADGLQKARRDPILSKAMGEHVSEQQMAYWMQELIEITLMDYIFSQQDRIGNIDYLPYWHWEHEGELQLSASIEKPEAARADAQLLRRSWLNDNDAGGKRQYMNYTKRTGMLESLRHYNPETYLRLMALNADLDAQGALYVYVRDTFGLTSAQLGRIVTATAEAAAILRTACKANKLLFDLDPDQLLLQGSVPARVVDCEP